ncbi:hypothetical protein Enr10x_58260 [Gimesia panareensis]|uniref:Uncharacterized protein n=2 Tax=Gimesia panareensis TaxID=2527978 RepID=A0A517QFP0_9PLAN|nr:hypothetical protein Enr10x_58260 [Gimesia panareensis]QDU53518.1 hypothetical protein Pan110_59100 [Gimesia panareensis]
MKLRHPNVNLDPTVMRAQPQHHRRGSFVLIPMLCLILALAVIGEILKQTTIETGQLKQQHFQLQSSWLADAAAQRAVTKLAQNPDYEGEIWKTQPEEMGQDYPGEVVIKVQKNRQMESSVIIRTEASYPVKDSGRVRIVREWPCKIKGQKSGN